MDRRLAILIDGENISANNFDSLERHIETLGVGDDWRVFADFNVGSHAEWLDVCRQTIIKPELQLSAGTGKNSADIALVICAMDLCHLGTLDGFVIVSNDRDFVPLVRRLRQNHLFVHGIGTTLLDEKIAKAYSTYYVLKAGPIAKRAKIAPRSKAPPALKNAPTDSIFYMAINQILTQEHMTLSKVGQELRVAAPDLRSIIGKGKLKKLILNEPRLILSNNMVGRHKG